MQVEANPVQIRFQCFKSAVMANSKLDYSAKSGRNAFTSFSIPRGPGWWREGFPTHVKTAEVLV